jgi:hypothetical protein
VVVVGSGAVVCSGLVVCSIYPSWVGSERVAGWGVVVGAVVASAPAQEGMQTSEPGRRGHGFRIRTARQPRHEALDAPAVARPLMHMGAGNMPSVRKKRAREGHTAVGRVAVVERVTVIGREGHRRREGHCSHSPPRSSSPVRYGIRSPQPGMILGIGRRSRAHAPKGSTGHGAPGAGACLRLHQTRSADPLSAQAAKLVWQQCAETRELLGETVLAMH